MMKIILKLLRAVCVLGDSLDDANVTNAHYDSVSALVAAAITDREKHGKGKSIVEGKNPLTVCPNCGFVK